MAAAKRRAGRAAPDPEVVERALDARRRGLTQVQVAEICSVTAATIQRWERKYGYQPPEPRPVQAPDAPGLDPEEPGDVAGGTAALLEELQGAVRDLRRARRSASRAGDARSVSTYINALSRIAPTLARLETVHANETETIRIPRAAFEAAARSYRERVSKVLAQPLTCAKCGAALRASLAGVTLDAVAPPEAGRSEQ